MTNSQQREGSEIESIDSYPFVRRWLVVIALAAIICAAGAVRIRLLDMPLERDEGEYAYAGQLMLQGIPPYKLAYNMKLPGTYAAYALIMGLFGQTIRGVHLGLILINSAAIVLVYLIGQKLFGRICGLVAAATFALFALSDSVLGFAAHATHFVILFALAGTVLLLRKHGTVSDSALFFAGSLFGLAFLMKQSGVFFGLWAGTLIMCLQRWRSGDWVRSVGRTMLFAAGAILPFVATCVVLILCAAFDRFWFWALSYAREYVTQLSISEGWEQFRAALLGIYRAAPGLCLLAATGPCLLLFVRQARRCGWVLFSFTVAAFLTVCPGFYFREHYFIAVLPALALWAGATIQIVHDHIIRSGMNRRWLLVLYAAVLLALAEGGFHHRALFFVLKPNEAARYIYGYNPFAEATVIGRYLRDNSQPGDCIAVLGSEPEIYFYSQRHAATGYIYTYAFAEENKYAAEMQHQMRQEIEAARPLYVVFVSVPQSWLSSGHSHEVTLPWFPSYASKNLKQDGYIDILSPRQTDYELGTWRGAHRRPNSTSSFLILYKRRTDL